jgi:hypothetical protein
MSSNPCTSDSSGISSASASPSRSASAASVALVEDQADDREHGGEPVRKELIGWHPERDARGLDLPLRPHQPLGHRRFGYQECAGDLRSSGRRASEE